MPDPFNPTFTTNHGDIVFMAERLKSLPVMYLEHSLLLMLLVGSGSVLNVKSPTVEIPFYLSAGASGATWIGPDDILPEGGQRELAMGFAGPSYIANGWSWNRLEQAITRDISSRLFNEMEMKAAEVEYAMVRQMAYSMWNGAGGKEIQGVSAILEAAAPAAQTGIHAGVDKAANPWMRNQFVELLTHAGDIRFGSTIPAIFLAMDEIINLCTVGNHRPSHIVTTRAIYELLRRAFNEMNRPGHPVSSLGDLKWGFSTFEYDGVKVCYDNMCPTGRMYVLHIVDNTDAMKVNNGMSHGTRDSFWEHAGVPSPLELDAGGLTLMKHTNVNRMIIDQPSTGRRLTEGRYVIDSAGLLLRRPSDFGVLAERNAGDASRWT